MNIFKDLRHWLERMFAKVTGSNRARSGFLCPPSSKLVPDTKAGEEN